MVPKNTSTCSRVPCTLTTLAKLVCISMSFQTTLELRLSPPSLSGAAVSFSSFAKGSSLFR
ncbi:hypothetical protein R2601_02708 [Salipiger bermudensis HTCC2601]|uniref:Uncharacterized protein n=1 Tax=Salipiger bermudensis (strain DSM 26914 / JCM 13377 / KCTC 12554 / HTCC2601) TaxID=314265 RepID=Q0FWV4_SALBH|nr:hypothetical protein R2601_02708 [Salipiger bermudensis HTCC2601]